MYDTLLCEWYKRNNDSFSHILVLYFLELPFFSLNFLFFPLNFLYPDPLNYANNDETVEARPRDERSVTTACNCQVLTPSVTELPLEKRLEP